MVAAFEEEVTRIRRDLHRIPEIGYQERKTQAYIISYLLHLSPDRIEKIALTGVKAVFLAPGAQRTTAFRADIDGLALHENNPNLEFASTHEGRMHACGHDGHTATLLTFARLISENREQLRENVVLLFQPAEEHIGGAKRMVEEGALEDPPVDRIFGMHLWPDIPQGHIGFREGPMMAQTCEFDLTIRGKSAHGASPHKGIDAIVVAAEIISFMQTVVSRCIDPYEKALITVGKIQGGEARNIIADTVVMNGTIRSFKNSVHEAVKEHIRDILEGMKRSTGIGYDFTEVMHYPVLENPPAMCAMLSLLTEFEGIVVVDEIMAAEDFAFYQQYVPGMFFLLGIGSERGCKPLHNVSFDFDEKALLGGVEVYRRILGIGENRD